MLLSYLKADKMYVKVFTHYNVQRCSHCMFNTIESVGQNISSTCKSKDKLL